MDDSDGSCAQSAHRPLLCLACWCIVRSLRSPWRTSASEHDVISPIAGALDHQAAWQVPDLLQPDLKSVMIALSSMFRRTAQRL